MRNENYHLVQLFIQEKYEGKHGIGRCQIAWIKKDWTDFDSTALFKTSLNTYWSDSLIAIFHWRRQQHEKKYRYISFQRPNWVFSWPIITLCLFTVPFLKKLLRRKIRRWIQIHLFWFLISSKFTQNLYVFRKCLHVQIY